MMAGIRITLSAALALAMLTPGAIEAKVPQAQQDAITPGMQYLYGSGEGAAISETAWHGLVAYVAGQMKQRPTDSVVLASGATLQAPKYVPCGDKPFAVVLDVDETVLLNLGFEYAAAKGAKYTPKLWSEWERTGVDDVTTVPGAREGIQKLRAMGVKVIFNTNRGAANAAYTERALDDAGVGPAVHGQNLFLEGDDSTGGHKDVRRAHIAAQYCVLAMAGDQLGDFSDLFNQGQGVTARREDAAASAISSNWGAGWFVLPNPVYGTGLKGSLDEVIPQDKRWQPPKGEGK